MSVALSAAQRTSIMTLRDIQKESDTTSERLSTGRKVNSVVDDAVAYFTAKSLTDRSNDILERKDAIDQGISTLEAMMDAITAIEDILDQMKGLAEASKTQSTSERAVTTTQFKELGDQLSNVVTDAKYNGLAMLEATGNSLTVRFSDDETSSLTVGGYRLTATASDNDGSQIFTSAAFDANGDFRGLAEIESGDLTAGFSQIGENNSQIDSVDTVIQTLDDGLSNLRAIASTFGSNLSLLETRSTFADAYSSTLAVGSDKLTLADMNEEGAKLTALQASQQIAIQTLAISGDQAASVIVLLS